MDADERERSIDAARQYGEHGRDKFARRISSDLIAELDRRDAQIKRLVTALRSQGLDQYFIDALLDVEGKS